jgi:HYDIN/CFA65/VesB family protein
MLKRACVALLLLVTVACGSNSSSPTTPSSSSTRIIGLIGSLAFGNVQVGNRSSASLTITNSGNSALTVSGMTVTGGLGSVFASSFTSGTISPGGSQQVTIQFAPTAAQTYSGTLNVNGDQTSGSNSIAISGTGTLLRANLQLASSTGTYFCLTGLCTSFTYPITNLGPGCATNVQVITRFYGGDGNGPQLGIDVPMGMAGGSLSSFFFGPGSTVTVQNLIPFNDIRSAHTVFKPAITWTDVGC